MSNKKNMKITNWLYRIFNWRKSPKATNEMKPVDMSKYFEDTNIVLKGFIYQKYWKVKKSWKRSPKNYSLYYDAYKINDLKIIKNSSIYSNSFQSKNNVVVGNLYTLYQQYYGKENKK